MKFFKNVLMAIFVLILSVGIFFLLVKDQKIKDDILRSTLELFGDDLMAMVPDGEQKDLLKRKYDDFLQQADKEEIPPEEIERVAATILNLTTGDTIIQAEEVLTALNLDNEDYISPQKISFTESTPPPERIKRTDKRGKRIPPELPKFYWNDQNKREMAERLKKVKNFHKKIQGRRQHDTTYKALRDQVLFNADSGLTVSLNIRIKDDLELLAEDKALQKQIENLEKENILIWKATIEQQKEAEKALKVVLEQIPQITVNMGNMGKILQSTGVFDSAQIEINQYLNADSLQKMIEESLKEFEKPDPDSLMN